MDDGIVGKRTQALIGTMDGVATVRVYSANPKTADGYNTLIFRRAIDRTLKKLSWAPTVDVTNNLQRIFAKEVQRHALATRREYIAALSARQIAERMVHLVAAPNEELNSANGIRHFEYGLAKVRIGAGLYLAMGIVGVRQGSAPYYDQHVVAKFKADSKAPSLHGHLHIGESAFERIYVNRFRLVRARGANCAIRKW